MSRGTPLQEARPARRRCGMGVLVGFIIRLSLVLTVPGAQLPNPWGFLGNSAMGASCVLVTCPQFLTSLQRHKGTWNSVHNRLLSTQLLMSVRCLWKPPKGGGWLTGVWTQNGGLVLRVPPPNVPGRKGACRWKHHQQPVMWSLMPTSGSPQAGEHVGCWEGDAPGGL